MPAPLPLGYPAPRSEWVRNSEACDNCSKRFTLFTPKSNCPNCGKLLCCDCLQRRLMMDDAEAPVPVCHSCYDTIKKFRAHEHTTATNTSTNPSTHAAAEQALPIATLTKEAAAQLQGNTAELMRSAEMLREENEIIHAQLLESRRQAETALIKYEKAVTEHHELRDSLDQSTDTIQKEIAKQLHLNKALAEAAEDAARMREELMRLRDANKHLADEHQRVVERGAAEREAAADVAATNRDLRDSNAALTAQLLDGQRALADTSGQLDLSRAAVAKLEEELRAKVQAWAGDMEAARNEQERRVAVLTAELEELRTSLRDQAGLVTRLEDELSHEKESRVAGAARVLEGAEGSGSGSGCGRWGTQSVVRATCIDVGEAMKGRRVDPLPDREKLLHWGYDVMGAAEDVDDILASVAREVALQWGLFSTDEGLAAWVAAAARASANYADNPYHNATHAADVLQGAVSLVSSCPGLLAAMTLTEKRAVAFAAMMHDVRHPGVNQQFLRGTMDPLFFQYNGRSVLEQMHAATAFQLLALPEADFTQDMSNDDVLALHGAVVEMIMHTDMALHDGAVRLWGARAAAQDVDISNPKDRLLVLSLFVHAADIGAQTKGVGVALKWTGAVEEMHLQGDREAALGLPVQPGNVRAAGGIWERQLFFMEAFVFPLYDIIRQMFPTLMTPLSNLEELHRHYSEQLHESRPFPPPRDYSSAQAKALAEAAEDFGAVSMRIAETERMLVEREDKLCRSEEAHAAATEVLRREECRVREHAITVEANALKLKVASAALIERRRALDERCASFEACGHDIVANEKDANEHEVHKATQLLEERERALNLKREELNSYVRALEAREQRYALVSERLSDVADEVRKEQKRLKSSESSQAGHYSGNFAEQGTAIRGISVPLLRKSSESRKYRSLLQQHSGIPAYSKNLTDSIAPLHAVLGRIHSALKHIQQGTPASGRS